jgi:uncharacterized protein
VAADFKSARRLRDDYQFQGCFYAELLERLQGTKPLQGYIITPDNNTIAYLIDEFEAKYKLTLHEIEKILAGHVPVHFSTSGCKQSPWFSECHGGSLACQDLSLLNRVWRQEISLLASAGIETVSSLVEAELPKIMRAVPGMDGERLRWLQDQAKALQKGEHIIKGVIPFPTASDELYFDVEADPLRDFEYLLGVLHVSSSGASEYHLFAAQSKEQMKDVWVEFQKLIEQYSASPIYHYGSYERDVLRRFSEKFGVTQVAQRAFASNLIDLQVLARQAVIFPLPFYSLKDIGAYIGYHWHAEDASGASSVIWFEEWLAKKDPALFQKIVRYNEDDVRATWKLKQWLADNAI